MNAGVATAAGLTLLALLTPSAAAVVPAAQQISVDPFTDTVGQHETAVEPDSFSFGNTVVATFQVGRITSGGASGIGWATSTDGGTTWSKGVLPALTLSGSPPGPLSLASDPAVAYDRVHGVWLINVLGARGDPDHRSSSVLVSRSADGLSWSAPIAASPDDGTFRHDKNWIACDNGTASPFAGRCYVAWASPFGQATRLALSVSTDGGATWGAPTFVSAASGFGAQLVTLPNGTLVVADAQEPGVQAVRSTDGGRTFSSPVLVTPLRVAETPGLRAPPFHTGEVDGGGRIYLAWPDCRYRSPCTSDIVLTSSTDGMKWTRARRVPTGDSLAGLQHVLAGLAVDPTTRGARARLGLTFYVLTPRGCDRDACSIAPLYVGSGDGGRSWSAVQTLAPATPLPAYPLAGARFLGDYVSTSFVGGGVAVPVFASAFAPFDGRFHQGVFATTVAPLPAAAPPLRLGAVQITPSRPRARGSVSVSAAVVPASQGTVSCAARAGRIRLALRSRRTAAGRVTCTWRVPAAARRRRVTGSLTVTTPEADATRSFSFRVPA